MQMNEVLAGRKGAKDAVFELMGRRQGKEV
jgi:hypothetical protein